MVSSQKLSLYSPCRPQTGKVANVILDDGGGDAGGGGGGGAGGGGDDDDDDGNEFLVEEKAKDQLDLLAEAADPTLAGGAQTDVSFPPNLSDNFVASHPPFFFHLDFCAGVWRPGTRSAGAADPGDAEGAGGEAQGQAEGRNCEREGRKAVPHTYA